MGDIIPMSNNSIIGKLAKASQEAERVIKAPKVGGMRFNALLHDKVQAVAMTALNANGLYPVCDYDNFLGDN